MVVLCRLRLGDSPSGGLHDSNTPVVRHGDHLDRRFGIADPGAHRTRFRATDRHADPVPYASPDAVPFGGAHPGAVTPAHYNALTDHHHAVSNLRVLGSAGRSLEHRSVLRRGHKLRSNHGRDRDLFR